MNTAEEIVRLLAEQPPPTDTEWDSCNLCGVYFGHLTDRENDPANHGTDCPWRMAREFMNPTQDPPHHVR